MEYFADPGDDVWSMPDGELIALADREVRDIGLVTSGRLMRGAVVRVPDAYPVYATDHEHFFRPLRDWLDTVPNLYCVGRNGQHRYNNMDHSMMTGLLAARSIVTGRREALWNVNTDSSYHEEEDGSAD
jgi:protoporphyrinogen oxidase